MVHEPFSMIQAFLLISQFDVLPHEAEFPVHGAEFLQPGAK
ncbi:hypothetical protein L195_g061824, partial [Trifolium pratense]